MRLLHRPRLDHDVAKIPVLALMREAALHRPRLAQDRHAFLEALSRLRLRDAETLELGIAVALADTEIKPATRKKVERRDLLGEQHWIVPRQHHDGGAKPQVSRASRDEAQQVE